MGYLGPGGIILKPILQTQHTDAAQDAAEWWVFLKTASYLLRCIKGGDFLPGVTLPTLFIGVKENVAKETKVSPFTLAGGT